MKNLFLVSAAFIVIAFTSCKKDNDSNDGNGNNPGVTKLLKKMTKTENGVSTVYVFNYDDAKLLSNFVSTDGSEGATFTYDANKNLIKVVNIEDEFKNVYTYTWNNGVPVSGTLKTWTMINDQPDELIEDDLLTYTLTNNKVTGIHLEMTQADQDVDFTMTYSNDNLSQVESNVAGLYKANFTFGNKKSAFPKITNYVLDQAGFSLIFGSKNELITSKYDFPGTALDETVTQQYTYDASGYPLTANDGETLYKYEYQ